MAWSEKSETARRIAAARILRGWDQAKLNDLLLEAEVGSDMATRLENDDTAFPKPRRDAVAAVLGVSEDWFSAPVETLLGGEKPEHVQETDLQNLLESELQIMRQELGRNSERLERLLREAVDRLLEEQQPEDPASDGTTDPTQNDEEDGPPLAQEQP